MSGLVTIASFLKKYLVPLFFVFGLMYLILGFIDYYILSVKQRGRERFLKSISWFVIALVVYTFVVLLGWLGSLSLQGGDAIPRAGGGADVERDEAILKVPNVPTR